MVGDCELELDERPQLELVEPNASLTQRIFASFSPAEVNALINNQYDTILYIPQVLHRILFDTFDSKFGSMSTQKILHHLEF